jgi:hypothetical protein
MNVTVETRIHVRDTWNGWLGAEVRVDDLKDVHWSQPAGAPRPILHGYVLCTQMHGRIPHECDAADRPHWLLVCVLRHCVSPSAYAELVRRASLRPTSSWSVVNRSSGCSPIEPGAR